MKKSDEIPETLADISKFIRSDMKERLRDRGLTFGTASQVHIGTVFTEFYVREIALYVDGFSDLDAIKEGLECDGGGDLGIDFIYKNPNDNHFWICQSKHKGKGNPLTSDEISGFFRIPDRISSKTSHANSRVRNILEGDFNEESSATFVLLTNGQASEGNKKEFEYIKREREKELGLFDWELIDLSGIKAKYKQAQSMEKEPPLVKIYFREQGWIDMSEEIKKSGKEYQTIVTVIRGDVLCELYRQHGRSLFTYNIRGFLGYKGKNKKIQETVDKEPQFFYLYNNGISAICTKLEIKKEGSKNLAECHDFQIINGAQTVCSIGEFGKTPKHRENLEKAWVLLRVTQAEKIRSAKGLNKKIITYNNTQNNIKDADFRSNDPVQLSLQKEFEKRGFKYCADTPYKNLVYMPKRMHRSERGEVHISMSEMAKSLFAFKYNEPDKLGNQTNFLFDDSDNGMYWHIFGDNKKQIEVVDKPLAEQFAAIAVLGKFLETEHKKARKDEPSDTVKGMLLRSGRHILWAFGYVIREFYSDTEQKKFYKNLLDGSAFNEQGFVRKWHIEIQHSMDRILHNDKNREDGKTLNFKKWLRENSKVKSLMRELGYTRDKGNLPKV